MKASLQLPSRQPSAFRRGLGRLLSPALGIIVGAGGCQRGRAASPEIPSSSPAGPPSVVEPSHPRDTADEEPVAEPTSLKDLGPFYEAAVRGGKLQVIVPSSSREEWDHWSEALPDRVAADRPEVPFDVRGLGRIFVVSSRGVDPINSFEALEVHEAGWLVEYPTQGLSGPVLGIASRPAEGARLLVPKPMARIDEEHPRARLLAEYVARQRADRGEQPVDLVNFELQELEASFGAADRVVAITAHHRVISDPEYGPESFGAILTLDASGNVVHEVYSGGTCAVDGVVDLDGDGLNEVLFSEFGYEWFAQMLAKVSASPTEHVQIAEYSH